MEFNVLVKQFFQSWSNKNPGSIILVFFLYPFNFNVLVIVLYSLFEMFMRERSDLLDSNNCNVLNKEYFYINIELISFGLEFIVKLSIAYQDTFDFFRIFHRIIRNDWLELSAFKNIRNGSICLKIKKYLLP